MILPRPATLRKYGLSEEDWTELYNLQGGACPICNRPLLKPCVDHFHVRAWRKMKPEIRKRYVRGLLCIYCNRRLLAKGITLKRARNIVTYLEAFEERLSTEKAKSS